MKNLVFQNLEVFLTSNEILRRLSTMFSAPQDDANLQTFT
jgi:hypothetical protein